MFIQEEEYREYIRNIFYKFALNKDEQKKEAFLDVNVAQQIFIALEKPLNQKELVDLEREVIRKNLLGIPYERFEEIYLKQFPYKSTEFLQEAFEIFDENHSGQVSFDEVKKVVESLSLKFTDQEIHDIFFVFDPKGEVLKLDKIQEKYK